MHQIETPRLLLRQPTEQDKPILEKLWQNAQVRAFLGGTLEQPAILEKISNLLLHWQQHDLANGLFIISLQDKY